MPVKSIRFPNQTTYDGKITSLTEKEKEVLKKAGIGGGSNINILTGNQPEQRDDGYEGTYSGVPDKSKINILRIPDFGDFVITLVSNDVYFGYVSTGDAKFTIILSEGEYILKPESSENPINIITAGDEDNKFNGTLVSPGLTLFSVKVPDQSFYVTIPVSSFGIWGAGTLFGFDNDEVEVYIFYEFNKSYETLRYHLKYYSHFISITNNTATFYFIYQNASENELNVLDNLKTAIKGKTLLCNGHTDSETAEYVSGEDDGNISVGIVNMSTHASSKITIDSTYTITDKVSPIE